MRFYKTIENGFIIMITTEYGQTEITEQEYNEIKSAIANAPVGNYALNEQLEWVEVPIEGDEE